MEFRDVSAVVPVVTETDAFEKTIDTVFNRSGSDLKEVIVVTCDRTTQASRAAINRASRNFPGLIRSHEQRRPFLGNAIREAFDLARGSHLVMMASDLETDPETFPELVDEAKRHPQAVITASRWMERKSFSGYGRLRVLANYVFQLLARAAYGTKASDLTFGYRLFPTDLVQKIAWKGERHEFLLETILKPLRLGIDVKEVSTRWIPRPEGESQNNLWLQAMYVRTALRCRFERKSRLLRSPMPSLPSSASALNE
jgi:glycosyltransferase involved in cell wall biosynthesis